MHLLRVDLTQIVDQPAGGAVQLDVGQHGWRVEGLVVQVAVQHGIGKDLTPVADLYPFIQIGEASLAEDRGGHIDQVTGRAVGTQYAGLILDGAEEPLAGDAGRVAAGDGHVAGPRDGVV